MSVLKENHLIRAGTLCLPFVAAGHSISIGCASACYADGPGFDPHVRQNILSLRFGHENVSKIILSLSLFQEVTRKNGH